jgi:hypothetical protein
MKTSGVLFIIHFLKHKNGVVDGALSMMSLGNKQHKIQIKIVCNL